jgi:LTXXQ motif family protein
MGKRAMKSNKLSAAMLVIAIAIMGTANAQTAAPGGSDQDHESHHPPAASEAPAVTPTQPSAPPSAQSQTGSGGMMGPGMMGQGMMGPGMMGQGTSSQGPSGMMMGQSCMGQMTGQNSSTGMMCMKDMMSMMSSMMNMMGAQSGMMTPNVEGRITALKSELKITDAQTSAWDRFAEAMRATAGSMDEMYQQMMQSGAAATLPARLERRETLLSGHLSRVKALKEALDPLYASFSDEQKKIADSLMIGPMGMM